MEPLEKLFRPYIPKYLLKESSTDAVYMNDNAKDDMIYDMV